MNAITAALLLSAAASAAPLPLPGYTQPAAAAAPETFPSASGLFGAVSDPLASLASGEDLRDSVSDTAPSARLQAALRGRDADARLAAVRDAARPRGVEGVPFLAALLLRLDEPVEMRAAAALAMGRIGDGVAVPALSEALKDPNPQVRYASALSLGRLPVDGVATRLERVLRLDPDWRPRYAAAIALGRLRKAFSAAALSQALAEDKDWRVRQQAARSLQDIGTPLAAEALLPALKDPEPSVRAAAGTALAEIGAPAQRRAVAAALREEKEPSVRVLLSSAVRRPLPGY